MSEKRKELKVRALFRNEEELVQGCLLNDREAQYALYQTYSPRIYPTCLRYVKQEVDAEEVLSNVFVKVFDKLEQYTGKGSLEGWIRTIAVRESLNYIKARSRFSMDLDVEGNEAGLITDELMESLDAEALLSLIRELPDGYRTVFNLYAVEGYSHKEIGKSLGISESTSKTQLFKARHALKKALEEIEKRDAYEA